MRKLSKLLFAAVLIATAFLSAPPKASASSPFWCRQCDLQGDCTDCCMCDGGAIVECRILCAP
jgi:hypothetical protein